MLYPHEELKEVNAPTIPKSKRVYGIGKKTLKKAASIGKGMGKKGISAAKTTTKVFVDASKHVDVGAIPEFEGYPRIKSPMAKTTAKKRIKKRVVTKGRMKTVIVNGIKIQVPLTTKTTRKKPKKKAKITTRRKQTRAKRPPSIFSQLGM